MICINGEFHAGVAPDQVKSILDGYRKNDVDVDGILKDEGRAADQKIAQRAATRGR